MDLRRSFATAAAGLLVAVPVALLPGTGGPSSGDEGAGSRASRAGGPADTTQAASPDDGLPEEDGTASFRLRALGGPSGTGRHDAGTRQRTADEADGSRDGPSDVDDPGDGPEGGPTPDTESDDGSADTGEGSGDQDEESGDQDDASREDADEPPDGDTDGDPSADARAGVRAGVEA